MGIVDRWDAYGGSSWVFKYRSDVVASWSRKTDSARLGSPSAVLVAPLKARSSSPSGSRMTYVCE